MVAIIKKSPCQDCEDRKLGCHSTCSGYAAYCQINEEFYKRRKDVADMQCYKHDEICKGTYKNRRLKHGF